MISEDDFKEEEIEETEEIIGDEDESLLSTLLY